MRAAVYDAPGNPEVFRIEEVPDPACPTDGVLIRVEAAAIEGGDIVNRRGQVPPRAQHVVGYAAAGTVVEVGAEVRHLAVGQRVATAGDDGSHAELRAVPEFLAWPVPETMDPAVAAAIPVPFGTSWYALAVAAKLQAGETVLVQAAASGVGLAAVQLAHRTGARVIAAVRGGGARAERLRALGADAVIDAAAEDVAEAVGRITGGEGAAVVVDPVGGATLDASIAAVAPHGRVLLLGRSGGGTMNPELWPAVFRNASLIGVYLGHEFGTPVVQEGMRTLIERVAVGDLEVVLDRRFALDEVAEAHRHVERGGVLGRVVLVP
ncbi:MAG: zinc-binding dehydrogenase [Gluconacetobacter diazotrophicus]|nr:zinc-binding dehydrogenase [Gluconacetobacter diazotrophicus]